MLLFPGDWILALLALASTRRRDVEDPGDLILEDDEIPPEAEIPEPQPYVPQPGLSPLWMLPKSARQWRPSSFGSRRPWSSSKPATGHHKGIDIRARQGDPVLAPTDGLIFDDTGWDGPNTRGLLMQSDGGPMLVLGAVQPGSYRREFPYRVKRGEQVATIGRYPGNGQMLHFEVYRVGTKKRVRWPWGSPQPAALVNPHDYLLATVQT